MKWLRQGVASILGAGPLPKHLAFIMDGNRRYAEALAALDTEVGHTRGYTKLLEALEWCLELSIKCVSVYAFSIENFKRSPQEVETLMRLAEAKLLELSEEHHLLEQYGVQVRVIGNLELLPPGVQAAAQKAMLATCSNTEAVLNICMAYTSSQEMDEALQHAQSQPADPSTTTSRDSGLECFQHHLHTQGCPPVDLLIRTSGETRLSDFLMHQSSHALLHFSPVLWPDFSFMHLLNAIISFQRGHAHLLELRQQHSQALLQGALQPLQASNQAPAQQSGKEQGKEAAVGAEDVASSQIIALDAIASASVYHSQPSAASKALGEVGDSDPGLEDSQDRQPAIPSTANSSLLHMGTTRNPALKSRQRRKPVPFTSADLELDDSGMFLRPEAAAVLKSPVRESSGREAQLRAAGMAGGYDSMDDDEDEGAHLHGCPCCIVKFMPRHRICTDPVLALVSKPDGSS